MSFSEIRNIRFLIYLWGFIFLLSGSNLYAAKYFIEKVIYVNEAGKEYDITQVLPDKYLPYVLGFSKSRSELEFSGGAKFWKSITIKKRSLKKKDDKYFLNLDPELTDPGKKHIKRFVGGRRISVPNVILEIFEDRKIHLYSEASLTREIPVYTNDDVPIKVMIDDYFPWKKLKGSPTRKRVTNIQTEPTKYVHVYSEGKKKTANGVVSQVMVQVPIFFSGDVELTFPKTDNFQGKTCNITFPHSVERAKLYIPSRWKPLKYIFVYGESLEHSPEAQEFVGSAADPSLLMKKYYGLDAPPHAGELVDEDLLNQFAEKLPSPNYPYLMHSIGVDPGQEDSAFIEITLDLSDELFMTDTILIRKEVPVVKKNRLHIEEAPIETSDNVSLEIKWQFGSSRYSGLESSTAFADDGILHPRFLPAKYYLADLTHDMSGYDRLSSMSILLERGGNNIAANVPLLMGEYKITIEDVRSCYSDLPDTCLVSASYNGEPLSYTAQIEKGVIFVPEIYQDISVSLHDEVLQTWDINPRQISSSNFHFSLRRKQDYVSVIGYISADSLIGDFGNINFQIKMGCFTEMASVRHMGGGNYAINHSFKGPVNLKKGATLTIIPETLPRGYYLANNTVNLIYNEKDFSYQLESSFSLEVSDRHKLIFFDHSMGFVHKRNFSEQYLSGEFDNAPLLYIDGSRVLYTETQADYGKIRSSFNNLGTEPLRVPYDVEMFLATITSSELYKQQSTKYYFDFEMWISDETLKIQRNSLDRILTPIYDDGDFQGATVTVILNETQAGSTDYSDAQIVSKNE